MKPWPQTARRSRVALLVVMALHVVLVWGLRLALQPEPVRPLPEAPGVLWLLEQAAEAPPVATAPVPSARPARVQKRRAPASPVGTQAITLPDPGVPPADRQPPAPSPPTTTADMTAPAASQATPSLLDSPATRRAIREAARAETLAERAARATDAASRPDTTERLGQDIAKGALGDCLKGEYAGGGMGILSIPFLVAAELRGKCRR